MQIELTKEEVQILIGALDLSVKTAGLQAAQVVLPLAVKLQTALNEDQAEKAE